MTHLFIKKGIPFILYVFSLILLAFLTSCQSEQGQDEELIKVADETPVQITLTAADFAAWSGEFAKHITADNKTLIGSITPDQWLQYTLDVPVAGRYQVAVHAAYQGDTAGIVWLEDYVDNKDDRTYNITGDMPIATTDNLDASSRAIREGTPLNAVSHPIRLHFRNPGIYVESVVFTLMRPHVKTPDTLTQEMGGDTWQLAWSDEFEGTGLPDTSKWTFDVGDWGWGNNELQYYTEYRTKNARQENGHLIIEAHKDDDGHAWTSARLTSRGKQTYLYGKIEFRAKVPKERGNWAAGWTLGDDYIDEISWPYCGEIDILESVGYEVNDETGDGIAHASIHCGAYYFKLNNHPTATIDVEDIHSTFHTYSIVWTPEGIIAYVDDREYFRYKDTSTPLAWPYSRPQNIILNLAMGGGWGGAQGMDPDITSQQFILDYVRVYAKR